METGVNVSPGNAHNTFAPTHAQFQDYQTLGFADPTQTSDVLDGFDFDSFLHDGNGGDDGVGGFDFANVGFGMDDGNTIDATN